MSGTITPAGMAEAATVARDDMLVGDFGWVSPATPGGTKRARASTLFGALNSGDVTAALGYSPANGAVTLTSFNSRTGAVTLSAADVSAAVVTVSVTPAMSQATIQAAINSVIGGGRVVFAPGTYNLASPSGISALFTVNNGSNVTLSGYGAKLIETGTNSTNYGSAVIYTQNGSGVTIEGFETDYTHPPFIQVTCTAIGSTTANFDVGASWTPSFPDVYKIEEVDPVTHLPTSVLTFGPGSGAGNPIALVSGTVYQVTGLSGGVIAALVVGHSYILSHRSFGANGITIDGTSGVILRDNKINAACGMTVYARLSDDIVVQRHKTYLNSTTARWRTANADGVHFENCSTQVSVTDSLIQRGGDDVCNLVSRAYSPTVTDSTHFAITVEDGRLLTSTNDQVVFVDASGIPQGTGTIASATGAGTTSRTITLAAAAPGSFGNTWFVGLLRYSPKFNFERNTVGYNRGRGVVGAGRHAVVDNNKFFSTFAAAVEVGSSPYGPIFNEAAVSPTALRIRNNTVSECGVDQANAEAVITVKAYVPLTTTNTAFGGGTDILISGNSIRNCPNLGVYVEGFTGVAVKGNTFVNAANNPNGGIAGGLTSSAIGVNNCDVIAIDGNVCQSGVSTIGMAGTNGATQNIGVNPNMSLASTNAAIMRIVNSRNTGATGNAVLAISSGGASGGDAQIQIGPLGVAPHVIDFDTSDNRRLKFSHNTFDGSDAYLIFDQDGTSQVPLRGYIAGFLVNKDAGTPNTKIDVTSGYATDSTNKRPLYNAAGGVIDCTTVGANGLDAGSLAASTWYAVFVIGKLDGTSAFLASTSLAAPTLPSGYVYFRCVGWAKTDGSANLRPTIPEQDGATVYWADNTNQDINTSTLSTTAVLQTLVSIPPGVKSRPLMRILSASVNTMLSSPDMPDLAPTTNGAFATSPGYSQSANANVGNFLTHIYSNTSQQIRIRAQAASASLVGYVDGWVWHRGANA